MIRPEFERIVPYSWALGLLSRMPPEKLITKTRYEVEFAGMTWEIDVFNGRNSGLVVAEIELPAEDTPVALPGWVGEEVSHDMRYTNSNLCAVPFSEW